MRDNIPCRQASAVKLAPDHTSKLDAVLVDPCFVQCLLARGKRKEERREEREEKKEREEKRREEKRREEKRREEKRREEEEEERREEKRRRRKREEKRKEGGGRERSNERSKDRKEERESPPLPVSPVLMSSTPPCVVLKRLRVKRQDARMFKHMRASCRYTRRRFESTHGGVLDMSTGGFFRAPSHATPHTLTHTHTPTTTHTPQHHTHTTHQQPHTHHNTTRTPHTNNHTHTTTPHAHHTPTTTHTHTTPHSTSDHDPANAIFLFFTVTTVMSVTSVILMRICCFRFVINL